DLLNQQKLAEFKANSQQNIYDYYHQPSLAKGGTLIPISPDAIEVNASNPSLTDSVELPNAFVDNDEVISRERVFSDDLLSGKLSFAKKAKKLEKMKSSNPRFEQANNLIEMKLDRLFNEQEMLKKPSMAKGGK